MSDYQVSAAFRAIRLRRGWRQQDVSDRSGVSRSLVSLIERGHVAGLPIATLRRVAAVLDIRVDLVGRWRGGELDRLLNSGHSALAESVTGWLQQNGWQVFPEVSFSIDGERGLIDLLAWHEPTRTLLVIELKTLIVDIHELVGVTDRKTRLATRIARARGIEPANVSTLVVVSDTATNRRRVSAHLLVLRSAYPVDGRRIRPWLRKPATSVSALVFHANASRRSANGHFAGQQRVRLRKPA